MDENLLMDKWKKIKKIANKLYNYQFEFFFYSHKIYCSIKMILKWLIWFSTADPRCSATRFACKLLWLLLEYWLDNLEPNGYSNFNIGRATHLDKKWDTINSISSETFANLQANK